MPGFFGKQSVRLMRERWGDDVDGLVEELLSMFADKSPLEFDNQLIINQQGEEPAIIIRGGTGDPIVIQRDGETTTLQGGDTVTIQQLPGSPTAPAEPKSGVAYGVIRGGGPQVYNVEVYDEGPFRPSMGTIPIEQMSWNSDESAPAGISVVVYFNEYTQGNDIIRDYWMLYPTWFPPPPTPP
jgi:hypothetical protein